MRTSRVSQGQGHAASVMRGAVALLAACVLAVLVGGRIAAYAALATNYDWYRGHESDASYTISTAGQMKALAQLVNGTADYDGNGTVDSAAVDFAGKSITVADALNVGKSLNFVGEAIEPVGTPEHPFRGSFDGAGFAVDNFNLDVAADDVGARVSNVGVFGYVGEGGSVANLTVGQSSSISLHRSASSRDYIANVGMVVGYCVGSVANCVNNGTLTVESAVEQVSEDDFIPVRNVGGVVGQCVGDVAGCRNAGAVSVSQTAMPDPDIRHGQVVARVGGVVGLAGDETRIGTFDKHIFGESDKHGQVVSCANTGMVYVDTPKEGALDRFNVKTNAESLAVGGIVGYSQGSVLDCTNGLAMSPQLDSTAYRQVGYVRAENGNMVGGICGSLRGVLADNTNVAWADDGADGADLLVVRHCANYGDVYARVTAGGVVGKASSYTSIYECLNLNKTDAFGNIVDSWVVATRWNKPSPGGIVGTTNGQVSYCANFANVASALWADEAKRTLTTQDGYYAAGIAGMLTYFDDRAPANGGISTPVSEVFSCYNAGTITAGAGMRQRGIVGQNDGYVHDNVLLAGVVDDDKIVYGDAPGDREASGTVGDNRVYSASELRDTKIGEAVALMNANSPANGWQCYWTISRDAQRLAQNGGFPLLNWQDPWGEDAVSIAGAVLSLEEDAPYTGGESTPTVQAELDGQRLSPNVDFRVVAEPGAIEPSTGRPYRAHIVGLGRYAGTSAAGVAYDIVAGDMSACTMTVAAHTFNYAVQLPAADDVVVRTPAGTVVDPGEYTFAIVDDNDREIQPVDADTYRIVVSAKEGSAVFRGTLEGKYRIKPASFMREVKFDDTTISYLGQDYPWVDSTKAGESDNPSTTLPYTGVPVKPVVKKVTYAGHDLVEGVDYKVIYGNANSDEGDTGNQDQNNMGKSGGRTVGCVTIRYINGTKCNFSSYANMFFNIVDDGSKASLSAATYRVEGEQLADGEPLRPVEIYLGAAKLAEGTDYTISYSNNIDPGTATFTATGCGRFEGTLAGSFEIASGDVHRLLYAYEGAGTAQAPFEATVVGVEYNGTRDTFDLQVPETVEHDGNEYRVVAVGEKAFGGAGAVDFTGSVANESKLKLARIALPAGVRRIGAQAFGSVSDNYSMALAHVDFAEGSQLGSIGDYAFARCPELKSFTVPAQVATIGRQAFFATGLQQLRFLTYDAALPSGVAEGSVTGSFRGCTDVTVYGHAAAAGVKAFVAANSGSSSKHGGKNFSFVELRPLRGLSVDAIAEQEYTGYALQPAVRVASGATRLVQGEDYELSYRDNVAAGTAYAVVTGMGRWEGTLEAPFTIAPTKMAKVEFSVVDDKLYDGQAASYAPALTYLERRLKQGVDYTLAYADADGNQLDAPPSGVGSYRLVATGLGSFQGTRYRAFRIVPASIASAQIDNVGQQDFTGAPIEPDPNISIGGAYLQRDRDYVLAYADNVERGQARIVARGVGGYAGQLETTFNIVGASLAKAAVGCPAQVGLDDLAGGAVSFDPVVVCNGALLQAGRDYVVSYAAVADKAAGSGDGDGAGSGDGASGQLVAAGLDGAGAAVGVQAQDGDASGAGSDVPGDEIAPPSAAGTYFVVVKGQGDYRGSAAAKFSIVEGSVSATDLSSASVALSSTELSYNGQAQMPEPTVSLGGTGLEAGRDYVVSYANNVGPTASDASATVAVHGIGAYAGVTAPVPFAIAPAHIGPEDVSDVSAVYYSPGISAEPGIAVRVGGRSLVQGTDFTVSYANNTAAGTARATVVGAGGYATDAGGVAKEFAVLPADLAFAQVAVADGDYTGQALQPRPTVVVDGVTLQQGRDFTVSYADNVNAGSATATVTAVPGSNYAGSTTVQFAIHPRSIAGARVSAAPQTYTGYALRPEVTVRVDKTILGSGDFTVSYANNVNAGTATATVAGSGNYTGTASATFAVNPANIAAATVKVGAATYTGKPLKPAVAVSIGTRTLKTPADYTLKYANNTQASKAAKVTVVGRGNYAGSKAVAFVIGPAKQSLSLKAKAKPPRMKASALKKSKGAVAAAKAFTLKGAKTQVRYAKLKKSSPKLSVNAKTGKITVAKGTKRGTYKIRIKATAKKTANYQAATATTTVKVKVA